MRKSFNLRDSRTVIRALLGALVLANLIATGFVMFPIGGSAEDLEQERVNLQAQLQSRQAAFERTSRYAAAVDKGRSEGDDFLKTYFLTSRTGFSTVLTELESAAKPTKIKARERSFSTEPVEGSDTLNMMSITAAYEGTYQDLMRFVYELDRSPGMLIIESMTAAPQANSSTLTVSMKLNTFVRDAGGGQ